MQANWFCLQLWAPGILQPQSDRQNCWEIWVLSIKEMHDFYYSQLHLLQ